MVAEVPDDECPRALRELNASLSPVVDEAPENAPAVLKRLATCSCSMTSPCPRRSRLRTAWCSFRTGVAANRGRGDSTGRRPVGSGAPRLASDGSRGPAVPVADRVPSKGKIERVDGTAAAGYPGGGGEPGLDGGGSRHECRTARSNVESQKRIDGSAGRLPGRVTQGPGVYQSWPAAGPGVRCCRHALSGAVSCHRRSLPG